MTVLFIVDIDTTIANNDHRAIHLEKRCVACGHIVGYEHRPSCPACGCTTHTVTQEGWDKFLNPSALLLDTPVVKAQQVLSKFDELDIPYHFITGRNEQLRNVTESWLSAHFNWNPNSPVQLRMRPEGNRMRASEYKEFSFISLLNDLQEDYHQFFFMEDDSHVFQMYAKYGIVIRCPEGWDHWCPAPATGLEPQLKR